MSTMLITMFKNIVLLAGVSGVAGPSNLLPPAADAPETLLPAGYAPAPPATPQNLSRPSNAALSAAIAEWGKLKQSDSYDFAEYANFLLAHPGWPGEKSRRAVAEAALDPNSYSPTLAIRYFERFPPITSAGRARYAEALNATGKIDRAREQARAVWRAGAMRSDDEARLRAMFPGTIRPTDHAARMDALLWQGATSAAGRELAFVAPADRPVLAARLAFRTDSSRAGALDSAVSGTARHDAGFIADRATWLRDSGQSVAARRYLARPHQLATKPSAAEEWYEVLLANARSAEHDHQYQTAWDIARQVDDAYGRGTDVSTRPLGERDDYTSLVWLAGTVAMDHLGKPGDAVGMFERYARAARSPQTQSKGLYWAGRAAEAAGDRKRAGDYYTEAAGFPDLYYGQLATERQGQALRKPSGTGPATVVPARRQAFYNREVVRAAELLGKMGDKDDQTDFLRRIADDAKSDTDHALALDLSHKLGRPDLRVMIGRSARYNGLADYDAAGFPSIDVPAAERGNWSMIHAIARQESQFDPAAISYAGARGLMQLMPGTAREAAGKLGLAYSRDDLITKPEYNIQLGASYIQRMLEYYDGSYPLAVAAYNAGPGNVNKWIAANGDPRLPSVDIVKWVEDIPIYQTKNYVQRVLENAVVYDLLNPDHAKSRGPDNLSWYLGKNTPG